MKIYLQKYGIRLFLTWGIAIRLFHFLINRDLFHDEAALALNLQSKSFLELTQALDFGQAAPIGFLWLEKLALLLFGNFSPDYALRLPPFLISILGFILFTRLSKQLFPPIWAVIAVAFFAFNSALVHYSVEVKQYIFDVGICVFLLSFALEFSNVLVNNTMYGVKKKISIKSLLIFSLFGSVLIWFSQPSIFVLASCSLLFGWLLLKRKDYSSLIEIMLINSLWLASFAFYFFFFLQTNTTDDYLQRYHTPYFMPLDFWTIDAWIWYKNTALGLMKDIGQFNFSGLAFISFLTGLYACFKHNRKRLFLLFPLLLALFASSFGKYSTISRLLLFVAPIVLIFVIFGLQFIHQILQKRIPKFAFTAYLLAIMLGVQTFLNSSLHEIAAPKKVEEISTCLSFIEAHKQANDVLYVYPGGRFAFDYYKTHYDLSDMQIWRGAFPHHQKEWHADFQKMKTHSRIWILLAHTKRLSGINDIDLYPQKIAKMGGKISLDKSDKGVRCILYEFAQ